MSQYMSSTESADETKKSKISNLCNLNCVGCIFIILLVLACICFLGFGSNFFSIDKQMINASNGLKGNCTIIGPIVIPSKCLEEICYNELITISFQYIDSSKPQPTIVPMPPYKIWTQSIPFSGPEINPYTLQAGDIVNCWSKAFNDPDQPTVVHKIGYFENLTLGLFIPGMIICGMAFIILFCSFVCFIDEIREQRDD